MLLFWHPGAFSNPPLQITCSTEINVCAACVLRMCCFSCLWTAGLFIDGCQAAGRCALQHVCDAPDGSVTDCLIAQVQTTTIVQALHMHDSMPSRRPDATAGQCRHAVSRGSLLPRGRSAGPRRPEQCGAVRSAAIRSSPSGLPAGLAGRGSMAWRRQRHVDLAARRAAGHSMQKVSRHEQLWRCLASSSSGRWRRQLSQQRQHASFRPSRRASAASPFLRVVLLTQD